MKTSGVLVLVVGLVGVSASLAQAEQAAWEELTKQAGELYRVGQYEEALKVSGEALEVAEKQFGKAHPKVAESLGNQAAMLLWQGRYAEAEPLYEQTLAQWQQRLAPEHPAMAVLTGEYERLLRILGKHDAADRLKQPALSQALPPPTAPTPAATSEEIPPAPKKRAKARRR